MLVTYQATKKRLVVLMAREDGIGVDPSAVKKTRDKKGRKVFELQVMRAAA